MKEHLIHKYARKKFPDSGKLYYKCILPGCTHYVLEFLIWNRIMICNGCGDQFLLSKRKQNQAKPKCIACTGRKGRIDELIGGLGL